MASDEVLLHHLTEALRDMPRRQLWALILICGKGWSAVRVAKTMKASLGAITAHVECARERLRIAVGDGNPTQLRFRRSELKGLPEKYKRMLSELHVETVKVFNKNFVPDEWLGDNLTNDDYNYGMPIFKSPPDYTGLRLLSKYFELQEIDLGDRNLENAERLRLAASLRTTYQRLRRRVVDPNQIGGNREQLRIAERLLKAEYRRPKDVGRKQRVLAEADP